MWGVSLEISSKSSSVTGHPNSWEMAGRCRAVLVEPPMAMSTRMALRNESLETMSLGLMSFLTSSTILLPVSLAICSFLLSSARDVPHPVRLIPMVSVRHAMVFAVNRPEQLPLPGHAVHSTMRSSSSPMVPAL